MNDAWQRSGFRSFEEFERLVEWVKAVNFSKINRQVALLTRCGFKPEDMMLIAHRDGAWQIGLQKRPEDV